MPQLFQLLPWTGGLNTTQDESMIQPGQLTVANHLVFGERNSRKKRDGINFDWDDASSGSDSVVGLHDFWYGTSTKTQRLIGVSSARALYSYNGGTRTTLTDAGTAWSGTLAHCSMVTFNNLCIIAVDGSGNVVKKYSGSGNVEDLNGTPPQASILREHHGRLWCNDKTNRDRLHYSPVHDHTQWNGAGDSGAIDIGVGDGDPDGIKAIFPSFKGDLFVAKRTKLYRISGFTPETYQVSLVSSGVGCSSHNSVVAVDQDDVFFVSERGVHSLTTTANYGDFSGAFVSTDIQKTFNDGLNRARLQYSWGAYVPQLNSVAFAFASSGATTNDGVFLFNVPLKAWYRWPSVSCQSLISANDSDKKRFYFGTSTARVAKALNGTNYDVNESGTSVAIDYSVKTGIIFPDQNPRELKGLKHFTLYYRPDGTHTISVNVKIDNYSVNPENQLSFSDAGASALLGSTFILGTSVLGVAGVLSAYTLSVDGVGHGFKVEISQNGIDEAVEIQGIGLEYEQLGPGLEVLS